ncbi:MAG: phosphatase PAP2 family protein [Bacteroidota bacterium]
MTEFFYSIDVALFHFINGTLSNSISDMLWPLITDYDKLWLARIVLVLVWLWLLIKGGRKGRTVALLIIPLIFISDKLNSGVIKEFFARPRPCHEVDGVAMIQGIRLLVDCGPGKSFPSSHAVNNFAIAVLFSTYYRKYMWWFLGGATLVALSRPAVGVHYPSDILGGAIIGSVLAFAVIWLYQRIERQIFPPKQKAAVS